MPWQSHSDEVQLEKNYRDSQRLPMIEDGVLDIWTSNGGSATMVAAADVLYACPIYVPNTCRLGHLFPEVTTGAAGNMRFGIYTDVAGIPATLLFDSGEVSTAVAGVKRAALGLTVPYGFYWTAVVFSATPTMRAQTTGTHWLGFAATTETNPNNGVTIAHIFAALPNPFGTPTALINTPPRVLVDIGKYGRLS